jgi:hypothetical protein
MVPLQAQLKSMVNESLDVIPQGLKGLGSKSSFRKPSKGKAFKKGAPAKTRVAAKLKTKAQSFG